MYRVTIWTQQTANNPFIENRPEEPVEYLDEYVGSNVRLFDSEDAAANWLYAKAEELPLLSLRHLCFTCEEVNEANVIGNLHTDLGDV